jgi:hypothetical protein
VYISTGFVRGSLLETTRDNNHCKLLEKFLKATTARGQTPSKNLSFPWHLGGTTSTIKTDKFLLWTNCCEQKNGVNTDTQHSSTRKNLHEIDEESKTAAASQ